MAVNIYGACSGSSKNKYDVRLSVSQNSQSVSENKSNVTVAMYLKRNDGYSASAYNANESENNVKLIIGGSVKVDKNLKIDTRNGATVKLASWTGDVSHSSDGSLSLSLIGSFSMGGTALSGGTVEGSFKCTDIPRASTMSISAEVVKPDGVITAKITSAAAAFSHKITCTLGSKSSVMNVSAGTSSAKIIVPKSWATEATASKKANIKLILATYKGSQKIGSKSYTVKFQIPDTDEYKPSFSLDIKRIDNSVPSLWGEYVKGISQLEVGVSDLSLKYGATVSAYTVKVGSSSKNSVPSIFDLPSSGDVTVSVTVKDSRGFSVKKSRLVKVCDYAPPSIEIENITRCDADGSPNNLGNSLLVKYLPKVSSVNSKNELSVEVKCRAVSSSAFGGSEIVSQSPSVICSTAISENTSYILIFTVRDSVNTKGIEFERVVPSADIPFNIRRGGKGAAFGCYAENDNELTVAWNMKIDGALNSENVDYTLTDVATVSGGLTVIKHFPWMGLCYLRMRFEMKKSVNSESAFTLAKSALKPSMFTPLIGYTASGEVSAGIKYASGDITVIPRVDLKTGDMVYISGVFLADSI